MQNKEIEEALRIGDDRIVTEYIDQLENKVKKSETEKQKLIEKLEEVLKEYEHIKANEDSAMNLYSEIRKIAKGEKE